MCFICSLKLLFTPNLMYMVLIYPVFHKIDQKIKYTSGRSQTPCEFLSSMCVQYNEYNACMHVCMLFESLLYDVRYVIGMD